MDSLRLVATLAYNLNSATLVGDPAPFVERLGERIRHPQPGDLVLEETTAARRLAEETFDSSGLGWLIREVREPVWSEDEWDEDEREMERPRPYSECPTERVFYVDRLDGGGEIRWRDASFIAIPPMLSREWLGEHPWGSGTVTMEQVAAELADSGFQLKDRP